MTNWKIVTNGTEEGTKLVDAATGQPAQLPEGYTAVVNLHVHQPEPPAKPVPATVAQDLAAFAARGKEPPSEYHEYMPSKQGPHRCHHAQVKLVPDGHVSGKLGEIDVPVEVVGECAPTVLHGIHLKG